MKINLFILLFSSLVFAKDIVVLQIDTGVDISHQRIRDHLIEINTEDNIDNHGHGTHIAGLILRNTCPEIKLISCKIFDYIKIGTSYYIVHSKKTTVDCFKKANELKVDYVNFSGGGYEVIKEEFELIKTLTENGTIVTTAAGNDNSDKLRYYPAGYNLPGLIVVGNLNQDRTRHEKSNYGFKGMVWEIGTDIISTFPDGKFAGMTGTSQATAVHLNHLLRLRCLKLK